MKKFLIYIIIILSFNQLSAQDHWYLNNNHGINGYIEYPGLPGGSYYNEIVTIDSGYYSYESNYLLTKHFSNGDLDSSFGNNGILYHQFGLSYGPYTDIIRDTLTEDLFVMTSNYDTITIQKLSQYGELDTTFASNGTFLFNNTGINYIGEDLLLHNNYLYLLFAEYDSGLKVLKLNIQGEIQYSYGDSGVAFITNQLNNGYGYKMREIAGSNNNSILSVIGYINEPIRATIKIDSLGNIDSSHVSQLSNFMDTLSYIGEYCFNKITHLSNGKYILSGNCLDTTWFCFCFCMIDENGNIDQNFANNGLLHIPIENYYGNHADILEVKSNNNKIAALINNCYDWLGQAYHQSLCSFSYGGIVDFFGLSDSVIYGHGWYSIYDFSYFGLSNDNILYLAAGDSIFSFGISNPVNLNSKENTANVLIFPNPTPGKISIEAEGLESVEVNNLQGQIISKKSEVGRPISELDLSQQAKGIYIIKVTTSWGVAVEKVILN